jgi:hypothetical protein
LTGVLQHGSGDGKQAMQKGEHVLRGAAQLTVTCSCEKALILETPHSNTVIMAIRIQHKFFPPFFVVLEFELKASHLSHAPSPFLL